MFDTGGQKLAVQQGRIRVIKLSGIRATEMSVLPRLSVQISDSTQKHVTGMLTQQSLIQKSKEKKAILIMYIM